MRSPIDIAVLPGLLTGLMTIEEAAVASPLEPIGLDWRQRRVDAFRAGRGLARRLMTARGLEPTAIALGPGGAPVWPVGVVGSIAHTDDHVCVVIGGADDYDAVGVDLEPIDAVRAEHFDHVFVAAELQAIADGRADPTTLFCCKEAVYKAVFPLCGEVFDFLDIRIELAGDRFAADAVDRRLVSSGAIAAGEGAVRMVAGHRVACFAAPARTDASPAVVERDADMIVAGARTLAAAPSEIWSDR